MGFASYSSRGLPGPRTSAGSSATPFMPQGTANMPGPGRASVDASSRTRSQFLQDPHASRDGSWWTRGRSGQAVDLSGKPVGSDVTYNPKSKYVSAWRTDDYAGDSYLRGMQDVDQPQAYELETKRGALQGLIGAMGGTYGIAGSGGGYGGTGGGFMAQGPGGMVAQGSWGNPMQYGGAVNPYQQIAPQAAMQQSAMPQMQGRYGGQGTFNDVMMGMGQQSMVDAGRANRQMQGQYYGDATGIQNQGVLGGLGLMNQQQQNMGARQNDMFGMANQWGLW